MAPPTPAEQPLPIRERSGWRFALLVPLVAVSAAGLVWLVPRVWEIEQRLRAAGARRTFALSLAFRVSEAEAIIRDWRQLDVMPLVTSALYYDWVLLATYTVYLVSNGLLLTWLLRFERRSFAPVLLCYPLCAALFDAAENLCVRGMLQSERTARRHPRGPGRRGGSGQVHPPRREPARRRLGALPPAAADPERGGACGGVPHRLRHRAAVPGGAPGRRRSRAGREGRRTRCGRSGSRCPAEASARPRSTWACSRASRGWASSRASTT